MFQTRKLLSGLWLASFVTACSPMLVEPELTLTASPRTIDGVAQNAVIRVVGVDDRARPGSGTVRVTSATGSLKDGAEVTLAAGEGQVDFTCARATDPACNNSVRITAEWVVGGKLINATTSVTIAPPAPVDAGTPSLTLSALPARFTIGQGSSSIVATYLVDSVPVPDASVTIAASLGTLLLPDGGAFLGDVTDSAGQVRAILLDNGTPGVSSLMANGPRNTSASASVSFDVLDAGPPMDGGYTVVLTSDKNQIIAGVGDSAVLTASVVSLSNVAGLPITFNTNVGRLGPVGGSSVGLNFSTTTDDAGVARAQLLAGSTDMGQSQVTARVDGGSPAISNTATVNIVNVSQIGFVSTTCPQTTVGCNLMGLQGSGFNETALVKFRVTDGVGNGVSGVQVTFALVNAPAGTSVDPMGTTNSMGEVNANVRSGTTVGTFSVTATALTMFTVSSPTIGVRGAKASNRGFTLRCDRVNHAAFASVTPPLPITVGCQVGLSDRYGNPVGTGTQVRLNSEAGLVPNNVSTTPFAPGGTNEGFGSFVFNTQTNNLPVDVAPFPANAGQYPFPLFAEPSVAGAVTRNPRDGLVTMIAYLQGEEDFKDDNSNGVRDGTEQFIDQGEPFVDSNDNNQWDTGEFFVDTPLPDGGAPNGAWDGPNGVWDSNAQIWTEYRLLYTGWANGPGSLTLTDRLSGGSYGTLNTNSTINLAIYAPDPNLNRVEGGAQMGARWSPATRGSLSILNNSSSLDGYGFQLDRQLVNASGTGPCSTTQLVCRWKVLLGTWGEGRIADLQLIGSMPPDMPVSQTAIVDVVVRSVSYSVSATGTVR